ncbi:MAG: non-heme iron oxygenase ferredoxin subunit [Actinobacteria bacterium]|nr:non-heme iron oxygenase ferredoxin subunit [Actinomycetota bacterium]MCL6094969.1 non-heme iron oxygenase ferredoxin subunit [Actinomycetota bacterium]
MNHQVDLCGIDELASGEMRRFEVGRYGVVVARIGDKVYAIEDRCSHANYRLSEGLLYADRAEVECPKHGSTFSLDSGEALTLPATKPVPVYSASVVDGRIVVTLEKR